MKNKKLIIILLILIMFTTGCVNINKASIDDIIKETTNSSAKIYNTYRAGYKFYLPSGLYVSKNENYNEVLKSETETYYLYIDLIGYINKEVDSYSINTNAYLSKVIQNENNQGYIEITNKNDKYLVEIMYNYAKIEVIVDEKDINKAVTNSLIVLSSIYYNDNVLLNLSEETLLTYKEEVIDIFKNSSSNEKSNYIEYIEDDYEEDLKTPDYDLIN